MTEWNEALNAYEVLGLSQGPKATDAEIGKAYRSAALQHHPDKNKGDPEGAKKAFQLAKDARDLLQDAKARAALDSLLQARHAREAKFANQDAKRRKMREKLEREEAAVFSGRNEEAEARSRLQGELARLKREAAARRAAAAAQQQAAQQAAQPAAAMAAPRAAVPTADAPPRITEDMLRTLKVSWSVKVGVYTSQQLRDAFAAHGCVEDVILRTAKKKSKGSALVVMATRAGAAAAAAAAHGDPANPLLVVPFLKVPVVPGVDSPAAAAEPAEQSAAQPTAAPEAATNGFRHAIATSVPGSSVGSGGGAYAAPAPAPAPAAPLFPVDTISAAPGGHNGWPAARQHEPLVPSYAASGEAASAAPPAQQSHAPLPTASSFRPPAGGFSFGSFSRVAPPPSGSPSVSGSAAGAQPQSSELLPGAAAAAAPASAASQSRSAPAPLQSAVAAAAAAAGSAAPAGAHPSTQPGALETQAQAQLRQTERARLIAQMEAEDAAEDDGA